MRARLTTRQIEPRRIDEAIGIYRDTVVPAMSQRQGSKGGLVMTDRGTGKVMVISLWETEADLRAYEPAAPQMPSAKEHRYGKSTRSALKRWARKEGRPPEQE